MFKNFLFYKIKSPFVIILFIFVFGAGLLLGKYLTEESYYSLEGKVDLRVFWEAWNIIEDRYIDFEDVNHEKMIYGAISGMIKSLDDTPSVFFNPDDAKIFLENTKGNFEGVGMEIGIRDNSLKVIAPLPNTPAEKAGLKPGDSIVKIDDIFTSDITIDQAVLLIRGEKGTKVTLMILRDEWEAPREFEITRGLIEVPSIILEFTDEENLKFAHIRIVHFSSRASSDFSKISKDILDSSPDGIILDLRNNPGGYLSEAKKIAEWFLQKGDIITIQEGRTRNITHKSNKNGHLANFKIIIIINEGSASASEILASAIRDNSDIKIVGKQSFGKGSVQELISLRDGSRLKITVAKWLTPKGELIDEVGIHPDFVVEKTEEDYLKGVDPQLDKAIEILKDLI